MRGVALMSVVMVAGLIAVGACADEDGSGDGAAAAADAVSSPPVADAPTTSVASALTSTSPPITVTATLATTTASTSTTSTSTTTPTTSTTTSTTPTTTSPSTTTTTTSSATSPSTTTTALAPGVIDLSAEQLALGMSVQGRPIIAERLGEAGGRRVLVIGVIHGDEDDGIAIVDELRRGPVPDDVELWLVESMNPDGQAADDRHNANQVDLNRNFPYNWGPIGAPGDGQYAGPGPASEPETQAMVAFIAELRPDIVLWYHQDLYVVAPSSGRDGRIRERYAALTGLPMGGITGGTYTGIAATWARNELAADGSVAFIVELGPTLTGADAAVHADAVRTIAAEG